MNAIIRPELDAKLELIEARMDRRVAEVTTMIAQQSGRIDAFMATQAERDQRRDESMREMKDKFDKLSILCETVKKSVWSAAAAMTGTLIAIAALCTAFYQAGQNDRSEKASTYPNQQEQQQ